jgi:hypothetical protein
MILLDTNVISELMKSAPDLKVLTWVDSQPSHLLFISTITIAEISYGLNALPAGKRRNALEKAFNNTIQEAFTHRILFFDEAAAIRYGKVMGHRKKLGRPLSILDGQIAAIALTHDATIATRNTRDFSDCQLEVINPFAT